MAIALSGLPKVMRNHPQHLVSHTSGALCRRPGRALSREQCLALTTEAMAVDGVADGVSYDLLAIVPLIR
jgi:hypothetical protein